MIDIIKEEHKTIYQTYKRLPLVVEKAEGCYIYDNKNNQYLDFLSGIAVNAMGNLHIDITNAIKKQMEKYLHISNYFYQEPQIKLAKLLIERTNLSKVFFSNSGAESVEGALKLIHKWGATNGKSTILSLKNAFHGRTTGALSLMRQEVYRDDMGPFINGSAITDANEIKNIDLSKTSAIIFEVIQGEGGISEISEEFVNIVNEAQERYGLLVVVDEIQTGIGRTGKMFSYQHYNLKPDIILTAKALGGGIPLGAIIVSERLTKVFQAGNHGTTFGGNALACVAGAVVLEYLTDEQLDNIQKTGIVFTNKLEQLKIKFPNLIGEVRGRGLMLGVKMKLDPKIIVNKLYEKKVLTCSASDNVLRILPPLIINNEHINIFIDRLENILQEMSITN